MYITKESGGVIKNAFSATARPIKIDNAFIRSSSNIDYPLSIITPKEYNELPLKTIKSIPSQLYFLPEYPLAKIYFNYSPTVNFLTLFMDSVKYIANFTSLQEIINLPPGYMKMLIFNLAIELESEYGVELPKSVYVYAEQSKIIFEKSYMWKPNESKFDSHIALTGGRLYNIERGS